MNYDDCFSELHLLLNTELGTNGVVTQKSKSSKREMIINL